MRQRVADLEEQLHITTERVRGQPNNHQDSSPPEAAASGCDLFFGHLDDVVASNSCQGDGLNEKRRPHMVGSYSSASQLSDSSSQFQNGECSWFII